MSFYIILFVDLLFKLVIQSNEELTENVCVSIVNGNFPLIFENKEEENKESKSMKYIYYGDS
jgi:hypothetical protein